MKPLFFFSLVAVASAMLTSCEYSPLCMDHAEHAPAYDLDLSVEYDLRWQYTEAGGTDWSTGWPGNITDETYENLVPLRPSGLRVLAYDHGTPYRRFNIASDGGIVALAKYYNRMVLYNNDTERIVFNDEESFDDISATTRTVSRASYLGNPFHEDEQSDMFTVAAPDPLFGSFITGIDIKPSLTALPLHTIMKPLSFKYLIRFNFVNGIQYVGLARGALSGMARSVSLSTGCTSKEEATILFDVDLKTYGLQAVVGSFGIPDYPNPNYSRAGGSHSLNLEVRLRNGKILTFNFDVTEQLATQPLGGIIEVGGIDIPDDVGKEDSGSFDIDIEGWGDFVDIPLNFN